MSLAVTTKRTPSKATPSRTPLTAVRGRRRPRFNAKLVAAGIVAVSLLIAVAGHAYLAEDQMRLGQLQAEATTIQAVNRATVLKVSNLETPERIAQAAGSLHLVQPVAVLQLPAVPLTKRLAPIKIFGVNG